MRILQVEDEPNAARLLARGLREEGYAVDLAADGPSASVKAAVNAYDLILLDILLPRGNGLELCKELRSSGCVAPILMLTACDAVEQRVAGLDVGADDYLTKPFDYRELLARIRALLRRGPQPFLDGISVGDLQLDLRARTVQRGGQPITVTAKEYAILEYLARHAGELVARSEIFEHAWDEHFDSFSNLIEVYMLRLRKKIDAGQSMKLLHTRRGEGYMLAALPAEEIH
jgi:two-component system copper resistance phosphate regulon response regulator CusR